MGASLLKPSLLPCLAFLLAGCETVDSEDVNTGDIIADIEAFRLTTFRSSTTDYSVEFIVVLREDSGTRPYIDLTGGDELELLVNSNTVAFTREEDASNAIRYLADWDASLPAPSTLTVRFTRGSGETFDNSITVGAPTSITEPEPGFEWSPNFDNLVVSWDAVEPPVESALVFTSCTQTEIIENISNRTFTVTPGTLVRDDNTLDTCPGYAELVQQLAEGMVATELDEASSFILDQAARVTVEAQY